MNKVIRFQGNTNIITKEPGYFYIADEKPVFIDQNSKQVKLVSEKTVQDMSEGISETFSDSNSEVAVLSNKVAMLEEQLLSLKTKDAVTVNNAEGFNQPEQDIVIEMEEPITGKTTVSAKSITVKQATVGDGTLIATATGDVNFSGLTTTGTLAKSVSNAQVSINNEGYVQVTNSEINQNSYNAIEIGLSKTTKSIVIDNVKFNSTLSNNAISIFDTEDNATVTISNCVFENCSNPLRISNKHGNKVVVNLVNCEFKQWQQIPDYAGCVICQDYTSTSAAAATEANLFAPDKVFINFINCKHNGEKIAFDDPATVCGTRNADTQLVYVYVDKSGLIAYQDGSRYPTITAK